MALGGRTDLSPAKQLQRLRVRHEKQADIHEAFLSLGRSLICWRWERAASPFGDERVGEPRKLNRLVQPCVQFQLLVSSINVPTGHQRLMMA
jgi:hypothetical protein